VTRKPNLFIVGAPKSGTTSLYDYLRGHPDIYMSPMKEPLYFCPDVRSGRSRRRLEYPRDAQKYMALFSDAKSEKRLGEATTRYLVSHDAAQLVAEFQADAYAIAMLRNPVDLVYSLHNERVSQGHERIVSFADAIAKDADREQGVGLPRGTNVLGGVYRESAMFSEPLQRWFDALGRERVHVVVFNDFASDPHAALRDILTFLDVDPEYQPASFASRNASHRQRTWVRRIVDSRAGNWVTHDAMSAVVGPNRRSSMALRFRQSRINRRSVRREPLDPALRQCLADEFRPDVKRLSEMLGRDLVSLWLPEPRLRSDS
jgi:hypothetical protein